MQVDPTSGAVSLSCKSQTQRDWEAAGGTYSTDPTTDLLNLLGGTPVFTCNGATSFPLAAF